MATLRTFVFVVLCLLAQRVHAAPIVIVQTRGAPVLPGVAQQITIHADVPAELRVEDADPLTFATRASELVDSGAALLVVWVAPVDGGYLVFVAGHAPGRALTELVRIDASLGASEIERTIALKIAGLLDAVVVEQAPVPVVLAVAVPPRRSARDEWRIEIDGGLAYESHERAFDGRVGLAIGRTWRRFAGAVGGYWQPSGTIERNVGRASIVEVGGVAMVEGGYPVGPVEVFARPRFVAAGLAARGVSRDGRSGRATLFAPYAGVEAGVRYPVGNVRFGAIAGCDFALIHRELVIDDSTVVDLGAARLHVGLTMTVSL